MHKENIRVKISDTLSFEMIYVEGGSFMMGDDEGKNEEEMPVHKVQLESFYLGQYQVTQNLWQAIMNTNPSLDKGALRPVENISWEATKEFIEKLNQRTKRIFRLPSESEWEYAARGGVYSQGYKYSGSDKLSQVAWYHNNDETHEVGQKLANELGLYDMIGNVWEWCEDDYHKNYDNGPDNGDARMDRPRGVDRVVRGGGYFSSAEDSRPACRNYFSLGSRTYDIGFRLVLSFLAD